MSACSFSLFPAFLCVLCGEKFLKGESLPYLSTDKLVMFNLRERIIKMME